jgi:hypothetical protein
VLTAYTIERVRNLRPLAVMRMNVYRKDCGATRFAARYLMRFIHDLFSTRRGRALPRYTVGIGTLASLIASLTSQPAMLRWFCETASSFALLYGASQNPGIEPCLDRTLQGGRKAKRATAVTNGERRHS